MFLNMLTIRFHGKITKNQYVTEGLSF